MTWKEAIVNSAGHNPGLFLDGLRKFTITLRINRVPAEIRNRHFPNMSQSHYCLGKLARPALSRFFLITAARKGNVYECGVALNALALVNSDCKFKVLRRWRRHIHPPTKSGTIYVVYDLENKWF
jgi:hypothetical protein